MSALSGSARTIVDEDRVMRGVKSIRHPLTRALLVLTFTTGLVDAVSYLALGHVFTANMTGNVVLLGFGLAGGAGLPVVAPIVSLAAFLLGSMAGGVLVKHTDKRHPALVARALVTETCLVALAAVLGAAGTARPGSVSAYVMIVALAVAMGVRNAASRRIGVPDLTTTVLTGTLTALAAQSPLSGGSGQDAIRRVATVLAMLAGALTGALLLKTELYLPLLIAAALALTTWLVYVPASLRLGREAAETVAPAPRAL